MNIKRFFETPRKAVISTVGMIAVLGVIGTGTAFATSAIAEGVSIGPENAQKFALADAGFSASDVQFLRTEFDFEKGNFVYEVEFLTQNNKYEYTLKSKDGSIIKKDIEQLTINNQTNNNNTVSQTEISLDKAKEIALNDAGVSASNATFTEARLDYDDGIQVYEIDFYTSTQKFDYEINASSGSIIKKDIETFNNNTSGNNTVATKPETSYIGVDKAKELALASAGLSASDVTFTKTKLDFDDNTAVYDIDFYSATHKYEYEINATTGAVMQKDIETFNNNTNNTSGNTTSSATSATEISLDKAKEIALSDAGVSSSNATFTEAKLDYDDGIQVYEIDFYTSSQKFDYEINASSGSIIKKDIETFNNTNGNNSSSATEISLDKAKEIALSDAGVSSSNATFTEAKLDYDDGIQVYEIDFYTSSQKFDYEINASSGSIIKKDIETFNNTNGNNSSSATEISLDKAKEIALSDAGVSSSNATFTEAKLDYDDGIQVYEIDFYTSSQKFDYEINATTGAIIKKDGETFQNGNAQTNVNQTTSYIGIEKAKEIAAAHAGFNTADIIFSKAKLDSDDGIKIYEIEFFKDRMEYEYEINAATGDIIEFNSEYDD